MQKLFKIDPARATPQAEKENLGQSRVEAVEVGHSHGEESRVDTKPAVPDTPAKTDKEFDEFESAAKGRTDDKSE